MDVIYQTLDWLDDVPGMPLSLLLSDELTNILISAHLYFTLLNGDLKWKQPNSSRLEMCAE
jgi:hypothetical protein